MLAIRKLIFIAFIGLACVAIARQVLQLRHHSAVHSQPKAIASVLLGKDWLANESLKHSETRNSASAQEKTPASIAVFEARTSEPSIDDLSSTAISASERSKEQPFQARDATSAKTLVTAQDFVFLGGFKLPPLYPVADQNYARGLTIRYREGQFRLLTLVKGDNATNGNAVHLYEISVPRLNAKVDDYESAAVTTHYGSDLWGGRMNSGGPDDNSKDYRSLYWDDPLQKLFFVACSSYSVTTKFIVGAATLNESTPSKSSSTGMWRFGNMSYKAIKGITPIPETFHRELGGRRLLAGFGGYESVVAAGPAHMGLAAVAFDPDKVLGAAANSEVADGKILAAHPYTAKKDVTPTYGLRTPDYYSSMEWDRNPRDGMGYFSSSDTIDQSVVWLETNSKKGVLVFATLVGNGDRVKLDPNFVPAFVSKTGDANGDTWTYDVMTIEPHLVRPGAKPFVGNTHGGISFCTVVSAEGNKLRLALEFSRQDNGDAGPVPNHRSEIFLGTSYFAAQIKASQRTTTMFCFDPSDLVSAARPLQFVSSETFVGPSRNAVGYDEASHTRIFGATFDTKTNRLYLLTQGGLLGVYSLN